MVVGSLARQLLNGRIYAILAGKRNQKNCNFQLVI
jgi:hypothetical protein